MEAVKRHSYGSSSRSRIKKARRSAKRAKRSLTALDFAAGEDCAQRRLHRRIETLELEWDVLYARMLVCGRVLEPETKGRIESHSHLLKKNSSDIGVADSVSAEAKPSRLQRLFAWIIPDAKVTHNTWLCPISTCRLRRGLTDDETDDDADDKMDDKMDDETNNNALD